MASLVISALLASVVAGVPDIWVAAKLSRAPFGKVLQTVASGVLGQGAYAGGTGSMALGLGLQVAMSFVIALIYNIAASHQANIRENPLVFGAVYGALIFVVMNFVVVPLSRAKNPQWDLKSVVAMLIVMIAFGENISFIATAFAG